MNGAELCVNCGIGAVRGAERRVGASVAGVSPSSSPKAQQAYLTRLYRVPYLKQAEESPLDAVDALPLVCILRRKGLHRDSWPVRTPIQVKQAQIGDKELDI